MRNYVAGDLVIPELLVWALRGLAHCEQDRDRSHHLWIVPQRNEGYAKRASLDEQGLQKTSARTTHHYSKGELGRAMIYAMALRELYPVYEEYKFNPHDMFLHGELNNRFELTSYAFAACDALLKEVKNKLARKSLSEDARRRRGRGEGEGAGRALSRRK
jgi:hypothetical protein